MKVERTQVSETKRIHTGKVLILMKWSALNPLEYNTYFLTPLYL